MSRYSAEARSEGIWEENSIEWKDWPSDWLEALYEVPCVEGMDQYIPQLIHDLDGRQVGGSVLRQLADGGLDALKRLGFNGLYLMGIWEKERDPDAGIKDHGGKGVAFCVRNHEHVDPQWGTEQELDYLIAEGKDKGIGIGVDLVFNHCSRRSSLTKYCLRDRNGNLQTAACTAFGDQKIYLDDVVQLDHSNPKLRAELARMVISMVRRGITIFRVDMAAQMLNRHLEERWGTTMPAREWLADIIDTARRENPEVVFIAEAHDEATAEELRRIGFNVVPSKTKWYDAQVSQNPRNINSVIDAMIVGQSNKVVSEMANVGGRDEASSHRALKQWELGAIALTAFIRPSIWLGTSEVGYDYARDRDYLNKLEKPKRMPLDVAHDFYENRDEHLLAIWKKLTLRANQLIKQLGGKVSFKKLVGSEASDWVGFAIKSRIYHNAPVYVVIGNPTDSDNVYHPKFGHIPSKSVLLIDVARPQSPERLV